MGNFFGFGNKIKIPSHSDMVLKPLLLKKEEIIIKPQYTKCLYTKIDSDGKQCFYPCECKKCTPSSMFNEIIKLSKPSEPKPLTKQKRNTCTYIESMITKNSLPMSSRCTCEICSRIRDNKFRFVFENTTEREKLKKAFLKTGTRGLFTRNNSGDLDFTSPTKPDVPADQPDDKGKYIAEQQKYEVQMAILSKLTILCINFSYPPNQNWFLNALKGPTVSITKSYFDEADGCFWSNK